MPSGDLNVTEALKEKLKQLKKDDSGLTFVIATANQKDTIDLLTSGDAASIEEILAQTETTAINFILYKVIDVIDQSRTTKFVLIRVQPESGKLGIDSSPICLSFVCNLYLCSLSSFV